VDCPGHASLIRTILGGAQLMDIMILLVDVTKGIQPQTGEGLVIGEIAMLHRWGRAGTAGRLVVVLNKMDVLPPSRRQTQLSKVRRALTGVLARTAFTANCPLIELSARPQLSPEHRTQLELALLRILASTGSHEAVGPSSSSSSSSSVLDPSSPSPSVTVSKTPASFVIAYDHCFQRKGSGAVLTGSVLSGRISVGDAICVPEIHATTASSSSAAATSTTASNKQNTYRVRSLQSFGRAVEFAERGARVGVCVSQGLPVQRLERGLAASPGRLHTVSAFISRIRRIRYFRSELRSGQLVHVTMGHTTKQAKLWFFDREAENLSKPFSLEDETFLAIDHLPPLTRDDPHAQVYTLFLFSQPVICSLDDLFLGSRLDMQDMSSCRLAFHGTILRVLERGEADLPLVGIYHRKLRQGKVSRVLGGSKSAKNSKDATGGRTASGGVCEVIGEGMFDRHTDISRFLRLQVHTRSGAQGTITAKFGSSGKFRATFEPSSSASSSTFASSAAAAAAASASSTSSSTLGSSAKLAQAARRALAAQTQRANDAALTCPTRLTDLCVRAVAHQLPSYREPLSAYLAPSMVQRLLACLVAEDRLDVSAIWSLLTEETRSLELTGWRLCNPEALAALCKQCPHLQRVSLRDCAHLESAALAVLLRGCTQLEVLDVSGCSHLGDQAFTSLGPGSLPVLSRLRLDGLAALSDAGIARLLSAAPALQALSMQRCAALTDTGLSALRAPLRSVDLSQCTQLSDDTVRQLAVVSGRQLHMAALSGLQLGDAALATLAQHCSALTSVSVAGCQRITDHGLLQLMRSCGALGELNVADCRGLTGEAFSRLEVALPALQRLNLARCFHLEPQHTRRLAERCPSLIDLDLQSCEALTDECIAALSHCCRHLEALRLANCMRLTDQAVLAIAQHSGPSLHELSLHNCGALTDGAVEQLARSCRSLQVLDLSWCEELTDRSLVAIAANLPALRTLRLEQVSRPSSPGYAALAEHCQQLRVLSLGYTAVDDHQLIALARGASLLEELDLSACQQLSAAAIRQAVAVLPSLRVLSLRRYERLDALTVAHPGLRALRLSFCAHLTDDCLLKLAVACPSLRELDVAWCTRLGSASIHQLPMHCPHLSTLSIRGCRGVAMLTVNALTARGVLVRR